MPLIVQILRVRAQYTLALRYLRSEQLLSSVQNRTTCNSRSNFILAYLPSPIPPKFSKSQRAELPNLIVSSYKKVLDFLTGLSFFRQSAGRESSLVGFGTLRHNNIGPSNNYFSQIHGIETQSSLVPYLSGTR